MHQITDAAEWFAIHTRSRFEKTVALHLGAKGYEVLLPLSRHARVWAGRRHTVELPLFPGYVFSRFAGERRVPILQTPGVAGIVGGANLTPVDPDEILQLRTLMASGLPATPTALRVDERVRVTRGPLQGIEGVFVRQAGACHVLIAVTLLQRGVLVEVDADAVEATGRAAAVRPGAVLSATGGGPRI